MNFAADDDADDDNDGDDSDADDDDGNHDVVDDGLDDNSDGGSVGDDDGGSGFWCKEHVSLEESCPPSPTFTSQCIGKQMDLL